MTDQTLPRAVAPSRPLWSVGLYACAVAALLTGAIMSFADLAAKRSDLTAAQDRLGQLAGGFRVVTPQSSVGGTRLPFLDGPTITVAGASLQERVAGAVAKAGGTLLSSEVHLDGPQAKNGFVALTASAQMGQPELQSFLYDIEAGMPYLYVDRLSIQSAEQFGEPETGPLRVTISVTAQWRAPQ